jgi:hypothetical protein
MGADQVGAQMGLTEAPSGPRWARCQSQVPYSEHGWRPRIPEFASAFGSTADVIGIVLARLGRE